MFNQANPRKRNRRKISTRRSGHGRGDDYLLDRVHDGLYVKERNLAVEESVLVWKEKAIFADLGDVFKHEFQNDTLKFVIKKDQTIVATNGIVIPGKDSTIVYWPIPASKEIFLKTKENDFAPRSDFAARFRAYTKTQN